jgi:transglutaminase-like putative cysteine protease
VLTTPDRRTAPADAARRPPGSQPPARPDRRFDPAAGQLAATVFLGLLTVASALGLLRVFAGHAWMGPVVLTAIGMHAVCWAGRRWGLRWLPALALALVALVLLVSWTVLGSATLHGLPSPSTWSHLVAAFRKAHADFASAIAPVQPLTGYTLIAVIGTGVIAVLGDWIAFRWGSVLLGAAPAFAMFVTGCAFGVGPGRQWAVALEVAALLAYLLAHQISSRSINRAWFGQHRGGDINWSLSVGSLIAGMALFTAILLTPVVGGVEGRGILGWRGGLGGGTGPREVANPVVDLATRLLNESDTLVFTVTSPVSSYWRLTSLSTFTGQTWVSTDSYRSFGARLPGVQAVPPGTRTVQEHFQIENLESVWLPDAFTPVSVSGVRGIGYDPASDSLITGGKSSDGLSYDVTSYQYLADLHPAQLEAAPPLRNLSSLSQYLALPASVPASVHQLADRVVAGQTTEYGKALALEQFFLGPQFSYSLNPPSDGSGVSALTNFLFHTKTGYCQQFAGAYAVLARAVGLPTRLAVGFSTGTNEGGNQYRVLDADAHTWPEVYFGPQYGWLPFEPTKGFTNPTASGYAGSSSPSGSSAPGSDILPPAPKPGQSTLPSSGNVGIPTPAPTGGAIGSVASPGSGGTGVWSSFLLLVVAVAGWTTLNVTSRRVRWRLRRRRARGDPGATVLSHWADVGELLTWWGIARHLGETDGQYAGRAATELTSRLKEPSPWLAGGVLRLARLATEASFAAVVPAGGPEQAGLVAREIHQRLLRAATGRQLVRWALFPQPGRKARRPDPVRLVKLQPSSG